ncbi:MAG: Ig-like domain-containing protein [Cyclobacteriaceae bacterium]
MKRFKAFIFGLGLMVAGISIYSCDLLNEDITPSDEEEQSCEFTAIDDNFQLEYLHNSAGDTSTFRLQVLENDTVCSENKLLAISSAPERAFANFDGDIVVFKHDKNSWGEFSFSYILCDERENCSEANVTLNITAK